MFAFVALFLTAQAPMFHLSGFIEA